MRDFNEVFALAIGNRSLRQCADDMGINASQLSRIKSGEQTATDKVLIALAKVAENGITLKDLIDARNCSNEKEERHYATSSGVRQLLIDALFSSNHVSGGSAELLTRYGVTLDDVLSFIYR